MRITIVTTKLDFISGGGSNFDRHNKALLLEERGCEVKFITVFSRNNKFKEKTPYKIFEENLRFKNFFKFHWDVCKILKKYSRETDIYYVDGHIFLFGAGLYRKNGGKTTIAHFDNFPSSVYSTDELSWWHKSKLLLKKFFEKSFLLPWYNALDLYTFGSPIIKEVYIKFGITGNRSMILPAFVDLSTLENAGPFVCKKQNNPFHILFIGRLIKEKGLDVLLKSIKLLQDYDLAVDVVGDGPFKKYFMDLACKLDVSGRVSWYPWIDRNSVGSVYKHAQLFVSPAVWKEPFGITTIEAMFFGIPAIVSSETGPAWIAENGAGLIFRNGDSADLADKIRAVYDQKTLREKLSQAGKTRVKDFDADKNADLLLQKLKEITKDSNSQYFPPRSF